MEDLVDLFRGGGSDTPCYGCGAARPKFSAACYVCDRCGRSLCNECWRGGRHSIGECRIPAAWASAVAAEWAAEVAAGRVTPEGVIATGVIPDLGGDV